MKIKTKHLWFVRCKLDSLGGPCLSTFNIFTNENNKAEALKVATALIDKDFNDDWEVTELEVDYNCEIRTVKGVDL